jgi:hypothetical protein
MYRHFLTIIFMINSLIAPAFSTKTALLGYPKARRRAGRNSVTKTKLIDNDTS